VPVRCVPCRRGGTGKDREVRGTILLIAVLAGLMLLAIVAGQNANEPAGAIIVGVIAGAFVSVPVGLGIGVYRQERQPRQPTVTHQTLIVYRIDAAGQQTQLSETTRTLTTTR